jgi:preprotein translocase subunit SecG
MENANLDKITSEIMAGSGLEITDPHFNSIIMNKIMHKEKQKSVVRYILFCSLFIIVVSVVLILLMQPGHPGNFIVPPGFDTFSISVIVNITNAGNWVMGNLFFLLPLLILLLVKKLIDSKIKHLQSPRNR